jgi:hypothetical protein
MNSTFLHDEKAIPPDEFADLDAPRCRACDVRMWLTLVETKFSDAGCHSRKAYECKSCGVTAYTNSLVPA